MHFDDKAHFLPLLLDGFPSWKSVEFNRDPFGHIPSHFGDEALLPSPLFLSGFPLGIRRFQ